MLNIISRESDGFTLLEMLMVITLIGIVSTLAIPRISGSLLFDSLNSSARTITGFIAETKQLAVRRQTAYRLFFDLEHDIIRRETMEEAGAEGPAGKDEIALPSDVTIQDILFDPGGKQSLGVIALHFTTRGYCEKAFIHLDNEEGEQMTIVVSPFLGVSEIIDAYVEPAARL